MLRALEHCLQSANMYVCAALESRQRTAVFDIFLLLPLESGQQYFRSVFSCCRETIFVGYLAVALKSRQHFVCPQLNTRRNLISLLWYCPLSHSLCLYLFYCVYVCVCYVVIVHVPGFSQYGL